MACWLRQEGAEQDDSVRNWKLNTVTKSTLFSCSLLHSASSASRSSSLTRWLTSLFTPGETDRRWNVNKDKMTWKQAEDRKLNMDSHRLHRERRSSPVVTHWRRFVVDEHIFTVGDNFVQVIQDRDKAVFASELQVKSFYLEVYLHFDIRSSLRNLSTY